MKALFLILILFGLGINIDLEMQRNYFLILHNSYREVYDYDDLARSPEIEKMAQESADYIMEKFSKNEAYEIPNNTYKGEQLAKNIYWGKDRIDICAYAFDDWVKAGRCNEVLSFPEEYCDSNILLWRQLCLIKFPIIWKKTKLFGCGISCNNQKMCVVFCNYYPGCNSPTCNILDEMPFSFLQKNTNEENLIEEKEDKTNKKDLELEKFRKKIIERHNYYRKQHKVEELERDSELEKIAQNNAKYMSEIDDFIQSKEKYNGDFIAQSSFYIFDNGKEDVNGEKIVDKWYKEIEYYDFEKPRSENEKKTNHFTNMIWKDTKKIGCGYSCVKNECYGCCVYYPSKSYEYIFSQNVLPKIKK